MTQQSTLTPQSGYETIRAAIAYLSEAGPDELDLPGFARALGLSERQLVERFRAWCGLSPKSFAQAVALDHAKRLLAERESVLATTYEVGLSSTSRLHDLFVTHEAMPPGVFRAKGDPILDLTPPSEYVTPEQQRARLDHLALLNEQHAQHENK